MRRSFSALSPQVKIGSMVTVAVALTAITLATPAGMALATGKVSVLRPDGTIHACVSSTTYLTRTLPLGQHCRSDETFFSFNQKGLTGLPGKAGAAGVNGTNGIPGVPGINGADGLAGTTGLAGTNGSNGVDGGTGPSGTNGVGGAPGANGLAGLLGLDGTNGTNGTDGVKGADGTNGTNGINGTNGTDGTNGAPGTNGTDGTNGATGFVSRAGKTLLSWQSAQGGGLELPAGGHYLVTAKILVSRTNSGDVGAERGVEVKCAMGGYTQESFEYDGADHSAATLSTEYVDGSTYATLSMMNDYDTTAVGQAAAAEKYISVSCSTNNPSQDQVAVENVVMHGMQVASVVKQDYEPVS